jgi:rare lipoprotein A
MLVCLASGACSLAAEGTAPFESPNPRTDATAPESVYPIDGVTPRPEAKSRYGNMPSYVVFGERYTVMETSAGYEEQGIASWYGEPFHGRRTSSGEIYDMHKLSAAHKSLPLPTYVEVTNLENGRQIVVRVNDRGPFHDGRVIDLSYAAARKLDIVGPGTAEVRVRALDPPAADRPD